MSIIRGQKKRSVGMSLLALIAALSSSIFVFSGSASAASEEYNPEDYIPREFTERGFKVTSMRIVDSDRAGDDRAYFSVKNPHIVGTNFGVLVRDVRNGSISVRWCEMETPPRDTPWRFCVVSIPSMWSTYEITPIMGARGWIRLGPTLTHYTPISRYYDHQH